MWEGFRIQKNYGRQKMNLIVHIKEKLKELDFKNSLG